MSSFDPMTLPLGQDRRIVIRCAREEDAAALLDANRHSMQDGQGMILTPEEYALTEDEVRTWIKAQVEAPKDLMLVADCDGTIVGNISFRIAKPARCAHWGTFAMAVRPGWRRSGVGNALLHRLLEWAASVPGIEKVALAVRADNQPAIRLYEKHGFVLSGCDKAFLKLSNGTYVDDLRMEKFLR